MSSLAEYHQQCSDPVHLSSAWTTNTHRSTVIVAMNYTNYEDGIIQGRKAKIVGWPASVNFASPSTIGNLKDMRTLHDRWMTGTIRWIRMSAADVKEHAADLQQHRDAGEVIGKPHKQQSTAGQKRKRPASPDSDNESSESTGKEKKVSSKPTKVIVKRVKRKLKSQISLKSKDLITDSDSDSESSE